MTVLRRTYLALVALLLTPVVATAVPIAVTGPCPEVPTDTCFVGVEGLDVEGTLYDMSFVEGTYADVFAANPGVALFDGNFALASIAAQMIEDAFRAVGFYGTQSAGGPGGGWAGADLAYNGPNGSLFVWSQFDLAINNLARGSSTAVNWMVFTASATVPEPGTLALLGIGLAGIGFARRRRKA